MRSIVLLYLILCLTACGSSPHKVAAVKIGDEYFKPEPSAAMAIDTGSNEILVCKKRVITGSHRKERTCVTQKQINDERKTAQESLMNNQIMNERIIMDTKDPGG